MTPSEKEAEARGYRAALEKAAEVADRYTARMKAASEKPHPVTGRQNTVALCKYDAGLSIAEGIRALPLPEGADGWRSDMENAPRDSHSLPVTQDADTKGKDMTKATPTLPALEPLPCPFCGAVTRGVLTSHHPRAGKEFYIACGNRLCEMQPETEPYKNPETAIAAWNRRTPPPTEVVRGKSDFPMARAAQIATEVLDFHEKGLTLEGDDWEKNAEAYKAKCIGSAAILAVKLQDALTALAGMREEQERLIHDIERHIQIASDLATENATLREALEDIEGKCADAIAGRFNYRAGDLQIIARTALSQGQEGKVRSG